jgi:hypothetical protein
MNKSNDKYILANFLILKAVKVITSSQIYQIMKFNIGEIFYLQDPKSFTFIRNIMAKTSHPREELENLLKKYLGTPLGQVSRHEDDLQQLPSVKLGKKSLCGENSKPTILKLLRSKMFQFQQSWIGLIEKFSNSKMFCNPAIGPMKENIPHKVSNICSKEGNYILKMFNTVSIVQMEDVLQIKIRLDKLVNNINLQQNGKIVKWSQIEPEVPIYILPKIFGGSEIKIEYDDYSIEEEEEEIALFEEWYEGAWKSWRKALKNLNTIYVRIII